MMNRLLVAARVQAPVWRAAMGVRAPGASWARWCSTEAPSEAAEDADESAPPAAVVEEEEAPVVPFSLNETGQVLISGMDDAEDVTGTACGQCDGRRGARGREGERGLCGRLVLRVGRRRQQPRRALVYDCCTSSCTRCLDMRRMCNVQ